MWRHMNVHKVPSLFSPKMVPHVFFRPEGDVCVSKRRCGCKELQKQRTELITKISFNRNTIQSSDVLEAQTMQPRAVLNGFVNQFIRTASG